jgi:hypothetical protein
MAMPNQHLRTGWKEEKMSLRKEEKISANCNGMKGFHVFNYSSVSPAS